MVSPPLRGRLNHLSFGGNMFRNQYKFTFVWITQHPCLNNFLKMHVTQHPNQTSLMYSHCRDITDKNTEFFGVTKVLEIESVGIDYMEAYERAMNQLNTYLMCLQKDTKPKEEPTKQQTILDSIEQLIGGIKNDIRETIKEKRK